MPKPKNTTHSKLYGRKRQFGTERTTQPLSNLHDKPSSGKIALSRFAIVLTILFWAIYVTSVVLRRFFEGPNYHFTMEAFEYVIIFSFLSFSALMYLVARQGALQRFAKHIRVPRAILDKHFSHKQSPITVLVPSYSEETQVIRKTLLSAALQEYPNLRVVLLLDDQHKNMTPEELTKFKASQKLAQDIQSLLAEPYARISQGYAQFEKNKKTALTRDVVAEVAKQYLWASSWLHKLADKEPREDHVDVFFADQVLRELAQDLHTVGQALERSNKAKAQLSSDRLTELYRRLAWIFSVEMAVFERKKYLSLSHESNKAMNLNAYIGLMGGNYREEQTSEGLVLLPVSNAKNATLSLPDSEFILTLDADSILLRDYCLRLVYFLEQPDNARVGVTQTPYSAFRGAPSRIERLSGATTDIQHILHQGMSYYGATFWVGANAVIRKQALEDIVEKEWVGGFEVKRYVQDHTVIEDTESSIDLALHGWKLVNYPERLSYSATPSDFGSLVVQRRRWANGGLLILPKLIRELRERKAKGQPVSMTEFLLRLNYMASITWASFGLIFLLAYPYDGRLLSPLVLLAALPYFMAMASDLKYCRYNYSDIVRIYGFNLILLPVNLAGVLKSLEQALTTKKIPFARTPKVKNRTSVGLPYVLAPLFIIAFSLFTLWRNIEGQNWGNAAFAGFNAIAATWAIVSYIGVGNMFIDIWIGLTDWLYVDVKPKSLKKKTKTPGDVDWKVILYHGEADGIVPQGSAGELMLTKESQTTV